MSKCKLTEDMIEPLVTGGCILGGGGGGSMDRGRKTAALALNLGDVYVVEIDDLEDSDKVITVSAVGAPAAENKYVSPMDYVESVRLLEKNLGDTLQAIITNENGGNATVNGILQSVVLGIPLLDAPSNGRAHPTGVMGSMGLTEQPSYLSVQTAVGGRPDTDRRVRQIVEGSINTCSKMIRHAAVEAGGLVTVARNLVPASYIRENAAVGGFTQAFEIGKAHQNGTNPMEKVTNVLDKLDGRIICHGQVNNLSLQTIDGFDLGSLEVKTGSESFELTFWNEYMTCETDNERLSTFPDLLMTFSARDGMPVTSAELQESDEIIVVTAPFSKLLLGRGMYTKSNYEAIEKNLNKEILKYIGSLF